MIEELNYFRMLTLIIRKQHIKLIIKAEPRIILDILKGLLLLE